jgi:hypothetical protein
MPHHRSLEAPTEWSACPICGEEILMKHTEYRQGITLSHDAGSIEDMGKYHQSGGDEEVFCYNEHTQADMMHRLDPFAPQDGPENHPHGDD